MVIYILQWLIKQFFMFGKIHTFILLFLKSCLYSNPDDGAKTRESQTFSQVKKEEVLLEERHDGI